MPDIQMTGTDRLVAAKRLRDAGRAVRHDCARLACFPWSRLRYARLVAVAAGGAQAGISPLRESRSWISFTDLQARSPRITFQGRVAGIAAISSRMSPTMMELADITTSASRRSAICRHSSKTRRAKLREIFARWRAR